MRKRDLSEFMTIELLYDYKIGKLDAIRTAAIEEGLKNSAIARAELDKLDLGINFCNQLKQTKVSDEFIKLLMERATFTEKILYFLKWRNLPQSVKWTLEATVVACSIILFITQFPKFYETDKKTGSPIEAQTITLKKNNPIDLEIFKSKFDTPLFTLKEEPPKPVELPIHQTEADFTEVPVKVEPPKPVVVAAAVPAQAKKEAPVIVEPVKETTTVQQVPLVLAPPPSTQVAEVVGIPEKTQNTEAAVEETTAVADNKPKGKRFGYIHRINLVLPNVDDVSPEITDMLVGFGAKKAGEVELGWRKPNGSYYHFTIPQENYDLMVDRLKKYGDFKVDKSEHPRIMPEGVLRFILWVEKTP